VLIAKAAEGLRHLLRIVQNNCTEMKMTLSATKSKVLSKTPGAWEIFADNEVIGCLEKVKTFKYLGMHTGLSPSLGAAATRKRAMDLARRYKAGCLRVSKDGPDVVDVCLATWLNIALPSIVYGCESVPLSNSFLDDLDQIQGTVAKFMLGLPVSAPNVCSQVILGLKPVRQVVWAAQLRYYVRLQNQDGKRFSKDAFLDHLSGTWDSPYIRYITGIKRELGIVCGPVTPAHVNIVLNGYFLSKTNTRIFNLAIPTLRPLRGLRRLPCVDETSESQVWAT
jgi:hypothetical protein